MRRALAMDLQQPENLAALADRYDALLCDIWGVVHNGRRAYPGVIEALRAYRNGGGLVVLISNVPKPRDPIPAQLARLGVGGDCYDAVVTSGDAIRAELALRAPGPFLRIGPDDDDSLWSGLGLSETHDINAAAFVAISGLNDPVNERPEGYADVLKQALARDLELLCANPDIVVRVGENLIWCAGAVAQVYADMGGRVVMAGKPFAPIYALAIDEIAQRSPGLSKQRILCIGDGVGTDVKGANAQGLDCLFVASGVHGESLRRDGALALDLVAQTLADGGANARYVMSALV